MPFCPKCRCEYVLGIAHCADCGDSLVWSLPPEAESAGSESEEPPKDWVKIATLTSLELSAMVIEALRAKDIPAVSFSKSGHFGQTGQMGVSLYLPVGGAFGIYVPREHLTDADHEGETILGDAWVRSRHTA